MKQTLIAAAVFAVVAGAAQAQTAVTIYGIVDAGYLRESGGSAGTVNKIGSGSFDQDARSWGVGYLYSLSKRSTIRTVYGHTVNRNGAGYTVANNTDAGTGDRAFNLGVRHTF